MRGLLALILVLMLAPAQAAAEPFIRVVESARFADGARGTLDVYAPQSASVSPRPVIVYFYGGAWQFGEKARAAPIAGALAAQGFVVVVPDYRVFPDVQFPGFIEDAAAAIKWTEDNIARYGGAADRIVLAGHSAGAHIAMLVALDERYVERAGADRSAIRGVVGMSGPYYHPEGFRDARLTEIFGAPADWGQVEPMHFVSADDPPVLVLVGDQDNAVPPFAPFVSAAEAAGVRVESHIYPGVDHGGAVRGFSDAAIAPSLADVTAFVRRVTQ